MTKDEMLKADLERAVKELELDGSNTKQRVKYLLEECLEVYFKPKKYLTYEDIMKLETEKFYKVRLNEKIYKMTVKDYIFCRTIAIMANEFKKMLHADIDEDSKDFINDLHLELVEE